MFTVAEVAEKLRVSPAIVYGWCHSGDLPHLRLGGKGRGVIRVQEADLAAFLSSHTRRKAEAPPAAPAKSRKADGFDVYFLEVMGEVARKKK